MKKYKLYEFRYTENTVGYFDICAESRDEAERFFWNDYEDYMASGTLSENELKCVHDPDISDTPEQSPAVLQLNQNELRVMENLLTEAFNRAGTDSEKANLYSLLEKVSFQILTT